MLISAVIPIMTIYRLCHGQYGYRGHVINLPQDLTTFATSLPRLPKELDILIVRKEGSDCTHRDFRVRKSVVLGALLWLKHHNKYYRNLFTGSPSAGKLFCLFFTPEVWSLIVSETNRHASTFLSNTPSCRPWIPVTVLEMKAFVGMLILMAISKLPRLEMYWSDRSLVSTPNIARIMSNNRFEQIFRFLNLCDNAQQIPSGQPGHDKLFKVQFVSSLTLYHWLLIGSITCISNVQ